MKTVGELLEAARKDKGLTLLQVEKKVKIRAKFLRALEKNDFENIPGGAIVAKGFIKNYGLFLGLSKEKLLASFRRDFTEDEKGQVLPRGYYEPLGFSFFSWTPKKTAIIGSILLILALFSYLGFQVASFLGKPPLSISSPLPEERVSTPEIVVSGKTDPDASVLIDGKLVVVNQDGYFEETVSLLPGENSLVIEAISRRNKKSIKTRKVIYDIQEKKGH